MRIYVCDLSFLDLKGILAQWHEAIALRTSIRQKGKWSFSSFATPITLSKDPLCFIEKYMFSVYEEGLKRNIKFKLSFIDVEKITNEIVIIPLWYIEQETAALRKKISLRDPERYEKIEKFLYVDKLVLNKVFSR